MAAHFRRATPADVDGILDVQEPAAVAAFGHIYPQDQHPFPRAAIAERWRAEIADDDFAVYVSTDEGGHITGFATRRDNEFLHFGTAVELWGTGLASWLHDELLATYPPHISRLRLRVLVDNHRARRFYEKHSWTETGGVTQSDYPPHPTLTEYTRARAV